MAMLAKQSHVLSRSLSLLAKSSKHVTQRIAALGRPIGQTNHGTYKYLSTNSASHSHSRYTLNLKGKGTGHLLAGQQHWICTPRVLACGFGLRHKSGDAQNALSGVDVSGYIPEPPPLPIDSSLDVSTDILNLLGEPTLASQGLCNYTPAGAMQWIFENMHVTFDLPWWGAIMATTICFRMILFPLVVLGQRNSAQMANHMPTITRLQEKFSNSRTSGSNIEIMRNAKELQDYMDRHKVNPIKNMLVPFAQMPIFISVFVGLRGMANLPVESMKTGGLFWFTDLTIPDPMFALPIMTSLALLATFEVGADGVRAESMTPMVKIFMRALPFVSIPFMINFPTALLCYWFSSNIFSLTQVLILKTPALKRFFKIPELVKHDKAAVPVKKKNFREGVKQTFGNQQLLKSIEERHKADAMVFKKDGGNPLQRTYKADPTKKKAIAAKAK